VERSLAEGPCKRLVSWTMWQRASSWAASAAVASPDQVLLQATHGALDGAGRRQGTQLAAQDFIPAERP